jgi:hypothetical protein
LIRSACLESVPYSHLPEEDGTMTSATVADTAELTPKWRLADKIGHFRRLLLERLGCEHDQLVFDDINDVSCKHCGEDFTD